MSRDLTERGLLERLARESHGKSYVDSQHVYYAGPGIHDEPRYEHYPFEVCPAPHCAEARTLLAESTPAAPDEEGLDAAWAAAEEALPIGWRGPVLRRSAIVEGQYQAQAFTPDDDADVYEYAATPSEALRALARALVFARALASQDKA